MNRAIKKMDPAQVDRIRRESGRVLRLMASPKVLASATGVGVRRAQMICAGEGDNALGTLAAILRRLTSEGVSAWRAVAYLKSEIMGAEMDVREVALETDYQAAMQQLLDRAAAAVPVLASEAAREDPASVKDLALDVAEAAEWLHHCAKKFADQKRAELRRKVKAA